MDEYIETVRAAVGVDIAKEARQLLPPDIRADGFRNTAYNLNVDLKHVEAYSKLAEIIVSRMDVETFAQQFSRNRQLTDDSMRNLVAKMGRWLFRGPLEDSEVDAFRGVSTTVATAGGGYSEVVGYVLEAMLQSPRFLYRIERQRGDGSRWPVSDYELASRISYILWGAPPDRELLQAAEKGELDEAGVRKQVQRMLQDPRTIRRSLQFFTDWLHLDRLDHIQPQAKKFPRWNPRLAADMKAETLAFIEEVVWKQQRPLADLMNAQLTFATPQLAAHYGLPPQPANGQKLVRYDLSKLPSRGGLLTQGGLLTIGGDDASMVTRGLFVLEDLLFSEVGSPPPGLDTEPVPSRPGLSQRMVSEDRIKNEACGGCHARFEPLAFGLERFDGLGGYREKDAFGNPLRQDGQIHFPGQEKPASYQTSAELMDLLAGSERVRQSITRKLAQFAVGRPLAAADALILERVHQATRKNGGTYAAAIAAIISSDLVRMTRTDRE